MKTWKKVTNAVLFLMAVLAMSAMAFALPSAITLEEVHVDGVELDSIAVDPNGNRLDIERGGDFVVRVELSTNVDLEDVEVEASVKGYEYNDIVPITDSEGPFDMEENVTYVKRLHLSLPDDVDEDDYRLRLFIADKNSESLMSEYRLKLDIPRKAMRIEDVVFNPENEVQAGRSLLTLVRVENTGEKDQQGVKVSVSIPELKVSASDFIDEVESGDEVTSEALYMRLPSCAEEGLYNVDITVTYDQGHRSLKKSVPLSVVSDDRCGNAAPGMSAPTEVPELREKTIITVGPTSQDVVAGNGAVFPVTLTNAGSTAKTYVLSVDGVDSWGNLKVSPSNVAVVEGGSSQTLYATVTPSAAAQAGDYAFVMTVKSGDEVLQQVASSVSVTGGSEASSASDSASWDKVKKGLEIGLVVLVVLLVILGLIIAFNKMKNDEEEEESGDAGQTYY